MSMIGEWLIWRRKHGRVAQATVAEAMGTTQSHVSEIERGTAGEVRWSTMARYLAALGYEECRAGGEAALHQLVHDARVEGFYAGLKALRAELETRRGGVVDDALIRGSVSLAAVRGEPKLSTEPPNPPADWVRPEWRARHGYDPEFDAP